MIHRYGTKDSSKKHVFETISDTAYSLKDLSRIVNIEEYVDCFDSWRKHDKGEIPLDETAGVKLVYGVNVRLNAQDQDIIPFIFSNVESFDGAAVASRVDRDHTIPKFVNLHQVKEIVGVIDINEIIKIDDFNEDELQQAKRNVKRFKSEIVSVSGDTIDQGIISSFFSNPDKHNFLIENICALQEIDDISKFKGRYYFWICAEDPSMSLDNHGQYLTVFMAITNNLDALLSIMGRYTEILKFVIMIKGRQVYDAIHLQRKEAVKSAKAAIMSRNMSHNLGSHVMAYLKQKLGSVTDIMLDNDTVNVLDNLLKTMLDKASEAEAAVIRGKYESVELPFLVGLGKFLGYIQERQDYIATVATDFIPYGAPVNFKDAIYDEINPDLRYLRHHEDGNRNRPYNILLNYIAKSEGLSRENLGKGKDIRFGYVSYDKNGGSQLFGFQVTDSESPALREMRKINFSLPGGMVGRQAFFSIIENLIRNAAKHGKTETVENLDITFDIIDGTDIKEGTCCAIDSRIGNRWLDYYQQGSDIEQLYIVTITDNLPSDSGVVDTLLSGINSKYLDKDGSLNTGSKGLKEMRISAAWLRSQVDESKYYRLGDAVDEKDRKLCPLVAVDLSPEGHLRFIIALNKNRRVAVIQEGFEPDEQSFFEKVVATNTDCWIFDSSTDFIGSAIKEYSHIIVSSNDVFKLVRPYSSNRIRVWKNPKEGFNQLKVYKEGQGKKVLDPAESMKRLMSHLYRIFSGVDENTSPIHIWDDQAKSDNGRVIVSALENGASPEDSPAYYVYRKHHATKKDFLEYMTKKNAGKYKNVKYIDGITGDNSSDRLVRRETIDEKWYCEHYYALNQRVAIIDERIFKVVHKVDETNVLNPICSNMSGYLVQLQKESARTVVRAMCKDVKLIDFLGGEEKMRDYFSSITYNSSQTKWRQFIDSLTPNVVLDNYLGLYNKDRGIDVFTVVKMGNQTFAIIGCLETTWSNDYGFRSVFAEIGTITIQENKAKVEMDDKYKNLYDFVSIHQGILDKIYEGLGIKKDKTQQIGVTEALHEKLMRITDHPKIPVKSDYVFLPGLSVHSGRAKPSKDDMPQKLPFIQYSAIEHAVSDCKFSLVELLDFARY